MFGVRPRLRLGTIPHISCQPLPACFATDSQGVALFAALRWIGVKNIPRLYQQIHKMGNDVDGPNTADSRYVLEDVPFGLVPIVVLGRLVGRPAVLHQAGIALISAMYGRDFYQENDLLQALELEQWSWEELQSAAMTGVVPKAAIRSKQKDAQNVVGSATRDPETMKMR